ncbi:unnamed protein product [Ectocarpus fasciculatus]
MTTARGVQQTDETTSLRLLRKAASRGFCCGLSVVGLYRLGDPTGPFFLVYIFLVRYNSR